MKQIALKILVENELYPLVLANSEDELAKVTISTVRTAINQFIGKYEKELTTENIDFLTEYIWTVINKRESNIKREEER